MEADMAAFEKWITEIEGYGFPVERFYDLVDIGRVDRRREMMMTWLKTAYRIGYDAGREAASGTGNA